MYPITLKSFIIICFGFLFFCQNSKAAFFINPNSETPANNAINKTDYLKASIFVKLSSKEFSTLTGTKLNFLEKIYFKSVQRKLTRELKKNPDVLITGYYDQKKSKFKMDPLWFVVGCILGPLGILFSFTSKQPKNKRTSAALGCIVFIIWVGYFFVF
ncbi:MAG: hypothetical protein M3Z26_12670 [Bacteroidota bacterium]|nr:hypothetical protein [Bacteroidota bacterium]